MVARTIQPTGRNDVLTLSALNAEQAAITLAGLLFVGQLGVRTSRLAKLGTVAGAFALMTIILVVSGCGSSDPAKAPKGTYTVTIVGKDTSSSSITASTSMRLTVD